MNNAIVIQGILKWFVKITLVLALITFSGHASGVRCYNSEPVKTELKITNSVHSKRIVSYTKIYDRPHDSLQACPAGKFTFCLHHYDLAIQEKLKSNAHEFTTIQQPDYLLVIYQKNKSDEFNMNTPSA